MPAVRLNELLSNPESINWDGRGRVDLSDQWLELYNTTRRAVDLRNWSIEIVDRTATQTYRFARRQVLAAGDHLVLFGRVTALTLDSRGGEIRLRDATGKLVDSVTYPALEADASYSRESLKVWHADWEPSPDADNLSPDSALTPTPMRRRP